jgi:acyl carrier protein
MAIRSIILSEIRQVAHEHASKLVPINDDLALHESGLDSLAIAVLVARLEDQFGANPFTSSADVALPVTIGEFVRLYEDDLREERPLLKLALLHD